MAFAGIDRVFVLTCTDRIGRLKHALSELDRIGVDRSVVRVLTHVRNPFEVTAVRGNAGPAQARDRRNNPIWCMMNHYLAIREILELSIGRALIVEDDERFLKDRARVLNALSSAPPDADLLMLDALVTSERPDSSEVVRSICKSMFPQDHSGPVTWTSLDPSLVTNRLGTSGLVTYRNAGAYCVTTKAAHYIARKIESSFLWESKPESSIGTYYDEIFDRAAHDLSCFMACPNICTQSLVLGFGEMTRHENVMRIYGLMGVDPSMYEQKKGV